jgi:hypothetical protein
MACQYPAWGFGFWIKSDKKEMVQYTAQSKISSIMFVWDCVGIHNERELRLFYNLACIPWHQSPAEWNKLCYWLQLNYESGPSYHAPAHNIFLPFQ